LLLAYAAGAATSLALALLVGGRVFTAMKQSLHVGEWVRRALGVAVLAGVAAIALGLDTGILTRLSTASTNSLEQSLLNRFHPSKVAGSTAAAEGQALPVVGDMPPLTGAVEWINSPPLTREALRGKVVVVDFWTYSCINCLRSLPYVRSWAEKYKKDGLVVIGVHTPEFAFEKDPANVRKAVKDLGVTYPVAVDSNQAIWRAFNNEYWPAHYFIDGQGRIRYRHFGEGDYAQSERIIQRLLAENGAHGVAQDVVAVQGSGVGAASAGGLRSPETYVGYAQAEHFMGPGGLLHDQRHLYPLTVPTAPDSWSLAGDWTVAGEAATLNAPGGRILYRFRGRDLHLVLGPRPGGGPVRFRIKLDGKAPGEDHGVDVDANGMGVVTGQRLYQLVRQHAGDGERSFEIEFLDPGVQAFSFTFG
jgi:thiol-disulfide isomerase/thioredoxin